MVSKKELFQWKVKRQNINVSILFSHDIRNENIRISIEYHLLIH